MLRKLIIKNFALVDELSLTFEPGLTVITGETGAGKSVLISALALALGKRADREQIRHGSDTLAVEAEFALNSDGRSLIAKIPSRMKRTSLSVTREVRSDGSSSVRIDNAAATLTELKQRTASIVELLSQHGSQRLLDDETHLQFLDNFGGLVPQREKVTSLFAVWTDLLRQRDRLSRERDSLARHRELLEFQQKEISSAHVVPGEEAALEKERRILESARTLLLSAGTIEQILEGDSGSALDLLRAALKELERMAEIDPSLKEHAERLSDHLFGIKDLHREVISYGSRLEDDPARVETIGDRLDELRTLKKKYGGNEEAILATLHKIESELLNSPPVDDQLGAIEASLAEAKSDYATEAFSLSHARRTVATTLRDSAVRELTGMGMPDAHFEVDFVATDDPDGISCDSRLVKAGAGGLESARFLFSANRGEPVKPLSLTASGGELSRLLLALKLAEEEASGAPRQLFIFDEIDAGIGGETALLVGKKLAELAQRTQVFVITHLHQIARLADHHLYVEKRPEESGRTTVQVRFLSKTEVRGELERMIALPQENIIAR